MGVEEGCWCYKRRWSSNGGLIGSSDVGCGGGLDRWGWCSG
jgi:hypothetical protein